MSSDVIMLMKNHMSSATCACADGWSGMDCSTSAEIMEALQLKNDALISHVRICASGLLHEETHSLQHRLWSTPTHPRPRVSPQVLDLFRNTAVLKCTTLKNMLGTASAIVGDLFSAGQKRVQLFETVLEILSGIFCSDM